MGLGNPMNSYNPNVLKPNITNSQQYAQMGMQGGYPMQPYQQRMPMNPMMGYRGAVPMQNQQQQQSNNTPGSGGGAAQ